VKVTPGSLKVTFELEDGSKLGGRIMCHRWYNDIPEIENLSIEEKIEAIGITYVTTCGR
jgi:hypothetical protein